MMDKEMLTDTVILKMFQVCDSLFPIGAFTLSNGLETMVVTGQIANTDDLSDYLESQLQILPYNDLGVMKLAYQYADDEDYIARLDSVSRAIKTPMEMRLGSKKLCSRFLKTWAKIDHYPRLEKYEKMIRQSEDGLVQGSYPIAVGLYVREICIDIYTAMEIFSYSILTAIVTNAVKAVPLSQIDGQRILYGLQDKISDLCIKTKMIELDMLGIGGIEFDIAAMNHEMLYSRMYMS